MNQAARWHTTKDIDVAMMGGYIGEVKVVPKAIDQAVHRAITGRGLAGWLMFYYGEPDERLRSQFGYSGDHENE